MSDTYYVKTFGGLEITNDNVTVNIVELFGKQLVNLLQVLLFHSEKPVQKDELIDILWPESKNPSSALKFSIFRLRAELNEIESIIALDLIQENISLLRTIIFN